MTTISPSDQDMHIWAVSVFRLLIFLVLKEKQINEIVFIYFYKSNTKQRK